MQKFALLAIILSTLTTPAAAFTLYDEPLVEGLIGAWGTFSLLYLSCVLLSIICVSLSATEGRRAPYALLLAASLFLSIWALSNTTLVIMFNIDSIAPGEAFAALSGIQAFCSLWVHALVFLAIVFVANERYEKVGDVHNGNAEGQKQRHPLRLWGFGIFCVVFVMGTVTGSLWAWYSEAEFVGHSDSYGKYKVVRNVIYATDAVFVVSGLFAVAQAIVAYLHMRRAGVSDRATKVLAFLIAPAYLCETIVVLTYDLVMNINENWTFDSFNRAELIFCVFINFFMLLAVAGLLILGMRKGDWYVWGGGSEAGKLSPASLNSKLDGPITNAFVQPNFQQQPISQSLYSTTSSPQPLVQQQPQAQFIYPTTSSPPPNLQPQYGPYGPDGRPLTYFSTTSNGSNVRPETTYTYVGEVDSMLNRTAYGQALQKQGPSPPPQPAGSPRPIAPQQTGSSQAEQFEPQHIQFGYR